VSDDLLIEGDGPLAFIVFNRPRVRNALTFDMWERIPKVLTELAADGRTRVAVFRGAGEHFTAGADIREFETRRANAEQARVYNQTADRAMTSIEEAPFPTLAMIRGVCLGGGCELAMACDLRLAGDDARFGIPVAQRGITIGAQEMRRLVHLVGPAEAKRILYTAETFGAAEALRMGLVNEVVPAADLEARVRAVADRIAANAPLSIKAIKAGVHAAFGLGGPGAIEAAEALALALFDSRDFQEASAAFLEKRKPVFTGR
jgi:enoyl-CoA hydratase/carnithine racemase